MEPNYHVQAGSGLVETWSTQQLSYDPHDWRRTWRDELKVELLSLGRDGTGNRSFLAARFESPVRDYACDAENVLVCLGENEQRLATKLRRIKRARLWLYAGFLYVAALLLYQVVTG